MKPLNLEQRKKFKELYLAEYSATMIFKEMGFNLTPQQATAKMRTYRNGMNLPKRWEGYKPKVSKTPWYFDPVNRENQQRRINRMRKLGLRISKYETKLRLWRDEFYTLTHQAESPV